jgi:glutamine amidotransferase
VIDKHVTLLDYGMANLLNVARAFEHCGSHVTITDDPSQALAASRLVVPGVGAFEHALEGVRRLGFDDVIRRFACGERPLLGICVGMQMLFDASEEFGEHSGLGILPGRVLPVPRITLDGRVQRVPHIGWSRLLKPETGREWHHTVLARHAGRQPAMYFVHSFAARPDVESDRLADCDYGGHRICAAVERGSVMATQFHPERSGEDGLEILRDFLAL